MPRVARGDGEESGDEVNEDTWSKKKSDHIGTIISSHTTRS